ncbi:FtsK/SpoIIIE domain-containing protein, partial [Faecousia sp. CLA-AA-H192]
MIASHCADEAGSFVDLTIEDADADWSIRAETVADLCAESPYLIKVDQRTSIDLRTSQSILVAGRTRSGKTYGIIAMLLQVLAHGADDHGSRVAIIDPKRAELSTLPGAAAPTIEGDMAPVIEAMRSFNDLRIRRQNYLNELSEERGEAVRWWDVGMHISLLFIDEYVSCRAMLTDKKQRDEFDNLLRIAATMGASAGCYCIVC